MWEYVLKKYVVPDGAKYWVLRSIGASWRGFKCRLKKKNFYQYKDNKTRWKNRSNTFPEKYFSELPTYWNTKDVMNQYLIKRNVRKAQKNMHTAGPKRFARILEEMVMSYVIVMCVFHLIPHLYYPNREQPNATQMFERTRKRAIRNVYCETYDDTANKIVR